MKLFETVESKWHHHCDAGMAEMLNYFAGEGDEIVTTKRKLYDEVNRRVPYPGVVVSERTIRKNLDLLLSLKVITIETTGGKLGKTIIRRGTGRGTTKKKDETELKSIITLYNDNIAIGGRAKWIKATDQERKNIRKCQTIANERGLIIDTVLDKVKDSTFLMGWKGLGHHWIFKEDNFIKIIEGIYDNNRSTTGTSLVAGSPGAGQKSARDIEDRFDQLLRHSINARTQD